ncbi:MAG: chromosome partitioning protein [Ahrensia sp.]|nr:chromosome partitioning protein [Ahrensia sp.]
MEHIRDALAKARVSLDEDRKPTPQPAQPVRVDRVISSGAINRAPEIESEAPSLRRVSLDPRRIERNRIVARSMSDPNHVAFNMLRTRVRKMMRDNAWKKLAVTSATPGCGKSLVTLNLGFSMARSKGNRTVMVDLDLKRPSIAKTLGIKHTGSIGRFLEGEGRVEDCFVEIEDNLIIGLNSDHLQHSSELLHGPRMAEMMKFIFSLSPDQVLFDLPPMRSSDDTLAFLPSVDAALLVVAAGTTTVADVDECEQQIAQLDKYVGIVMNKTEAAAKDYYYQY